MEKEAYYSIVEIDVLYDSDLSDKAFRLYSMISNLSNNKAGYCYLKHTQLAEKLGIKNRQLYNLINELLEKNYISKIKSNNRCYLAPTINKAIMLRKEKSTFEELFDYDWIND